MSLATFKKGLMSETKAVALSVASAVLGALWYTLAPSTVSTVTVATAVAAVLYAQRVVAAGPSCFDFAKLKSTTLTGKVVIVTGANSGIGYYTALRLAELGAKVIITCRTEALVRETAARMRLDFRTRKETLYAQRGRWCAASLDIVETFTLTCDDFSSVRRFAESFKASKLPLHILVNNAGMMVRPLSYSTHNTQLELHTAVNFFGPVLLTELLVETIKNSGGRVVHVASEAHRMGEMAFGSNADEDGFILDSLKKVNRGLGDATGPLCEEKLMGAFGRYGVSKLCNVYYAHYCATVHKVPTCSLHPGCVATGFSRNLLGEWVKSVFDRASLLYMKKSEEGAETTLYCCLCPEDELEPVSPKVGGQKAVLAPYFVDCAASTATLLKPIGWNIKAAMEVSRWAVESTK